MIVLFLSCSSHQSITPIILYKSDGTKIIVETQKDVADFSEYLMANNQVKQVEVLLLPQEFIKSLSSIEKIEYKNLTVLQKDFKYNLIDDSKETVFYPTQGFLILLTKISENYKKNKEFYTMVLDFDFDEYELYDSKVRKKTNNKELIKNLKYAILESTKNTEDHLSYINFSKTLSQGKYQLTLYSKGQVISELEFGENVELPIRLTIKNHSLLYQDRQNILRRTLGIH